MTFSLLQLSKSGFKLAKIRKEKEYLEIKEIFNKVINRHKENAKNALKFLK